MIDGNGDIFSQFNDYVFYGDSRVLHFVSYGYLEPTRVLANNGYSFQNVSDWDSSLRALNPKNIYFIGLFEIGSDEIPITSNAIAMKAPINTNAHGRFSFITPSTIIFISVA